MPKLEAVILDLDGTLVDTAPELAEGANHLLRHFGRRELTTAEAAPMLGKGMDVLVEMAFDLTGGPAPADQDMDTMTAMVREGYRGSEGLATVYPGVLATMEAIKESGVKLALCANKPEASCIRNVQGLGLGPFLDMVVGGDTYNTRKHDPNQIHKIIEQLGVSRDGCVFVGDAQQDSGAAHNAGIPFIAMAYGYSALLGVPFEDLSAARLVGRFEDLPAVFREIGFD